MPRSGEADTSDRVLLIICDQFGRFFIVRVCKYNPATGRRWKLYLKGDISPKQSPEDALWSVLKKKGWSAEELTCLSEVRYWKCFPQLYSGSSTKPYDYHVLVAFLSIDDMENLERLSEKKRDMQCAILSSEEYAQQVHFSSTNFRLIAQSLLEDLRRGAIQRQPLLTLSSRRKKKKK